MHRLTHFRLCPRSRSVRLALAELRRNAELHEEQPWALSDPFLKLNPSGELPVLETPSGIRLCGSYAIAEHLAEEPAPEADEPRPFSMLPEEAADRGEARRLIDWFHGKLDREVTADLLYEKVYGRLKPGTSHAPDTEILRAARANLRYHLGYVSYLVEQRRWLAGEDLGFADLAAAAELSSIDYLGEVPWEEFPIAKAWYARMKSRPSFRAILAERLPGTRPPSFYDDLDF